MQFLSISTRRTDRFADADFAALVDAEACRARELYADGVIRQIWHRGDQAGACIVLEADSVEEARARLETLPLVREGMLDVAIVPLVPYAGFTAGIGHVKAVAADGDV